MDNVLREYKMLIEEVTENGDISLASILNDLERYTDVILGIDLNVNEIATLYQEHVNSIIVRLEDNLSEFDGDINTRISKLISNYKLAMEKSKTNIENAIPYIELINNTTKELKSELHNVMDYILLSARVAENPVSDEEIAGDLASSRHERQRDRSDSMRSRLAPKTSFR